MDIETRKEEIQLLIASNNLNKAAKRTMDFVRDFAADRTPMRRAIELSRAFQDGATTMDNTKKNPLVFQLLELIDDVSLNNA